MKELKEITGLLEEEKELTVRLDLIRGKLSEMQSYLNISLNKLKSRPDVFARMKKALQEKGPLTIKELMIETHLTYQSIYQCFNRNKKKCLFEKIDNKISFKEEPTIY